MALWALCKEGSGNNSGSEKFFNGDDQKQNIARFSIKFMTRLMMMPT
jgi:hypothetical protein